MQHDIEVEVEPNDDDDDDYHTPVTDEVDISGLNEDPDSNSSNEESDNTTSETVNDIEIENRVSEFTQLGIVEETEGFTITRSIHDS